MRRNLGQPIPILPRGGLDELGLSVCPLKQHTQRRTLGLRLSAGNVPNDAIGLVLLDKSLRTQIDLPRHLLPRPRAIASLRDKGPVPRLSRSHTRAEVAENSVGRQPGRSRRLPHRRPITTPRPQPRMRHHLGPHRIEHHIAAEFQEMRLFLHQDGGEAPLQEMPAPLMAAVIGLRVPAIELAHPEREGGLRRFNQEMVVVIHQTIGMTEPAIPIDDMGEQREEGRAVPVIRHDSLAGIAATGHMVDGTGKFQTKGTSHGGNLAAPPI